MLLLPFLASLCTFVDGGWRGRVALDGDLLAVTSASSCSWGARCRGQPRWPDPGATRWASARCPQAAKVNLSFSLVPLAAVVATSARTMSSTRVVVLWPIQFRPVLAVLCLVCGAAIFVDSMWFGPGEPVVALVGLLLALWVVATSAAMLEGATSPS